MIRAFLSHSSADKKRYVRTVAEKLGVENSVYDEYTFEAGMQPIEEIIKGLDESQLFVVFLSNKALDSNWVAKELVYAHQKLASNQLQRIFPIIIDKDLTHLDNRIPQWMKDDYNLKYVSRPVIAARRIRQRLREISWSRNPRLKEKDSIFVGRNDLVGQFEVRVDDFDQEKPTIFIASGLPRIGRSSLLRHALLKCNIVRQSYEFPSIVLRREDSLEDFLLKIFDLGFSSIEYPKNLMKLPVEKRIDIAEQVVRDIQNVNEIILVHDEGCLIDYTCKLKTWFDEILHRISSQEKTTFLISARYRLQPSYVRERPHIFATSVPELSFQERNGLFKRLLEFEDIALTRDDYGFFSALFQGYPDQIKFACEIIKDHGIQGARKQSHQLTEFNSDKAATILSKYSENEGILDFLYLLSEFEFISLDFLFSIVPEQEYSALIEQFLAESVCDYVGVEKEFIRLNDVIRDFVKRNRLEIPEQFRKKLKQHLDSFLSDANTEDRDISDVYYSMKEGIKAGRIVPDTYLIPSHLLNSMRELYQERGHLDRVIELADRLLEKKHLLEKTVEQDVRYYLCLSLARKKDKRFLKEVQEIKGHEHNFLLGFYYRLLGRASDSIERLLKCINEPAVKNRAKRELVQVYLSIEDYEAAADLAMTNYEDNRRNAFHIQAYFNTIVNSHKAQENRDLLIRLINELREVGSDVSAQMADIANAEFLAKCEGNYTASADAIDDAVQKYPNAHYPLFSKAFLAARNHDLKRLKSAYEKLVEIANERTISKESLARLMSYLLAMEGNLVEAIDYAERNLKRIPEHARQIFINRLKDIHEQEASNCQQKR